MGVGIVRVSKVMLADMLCFHKDWEIGKIAESRNDTIMMEISGPEFPDGKECTIVYTKKEGKIDTVTVGEVV
jgi:hypothetical protein